jgi:alkanesulfonate monooxygenase SsuD/methylene tetrahydromethanopterin reductase-like flavin-dependent oxidoreductase (luciferase family)
MATTTLRLQTGVLGNDYRHPLLTHRLVATLDQLSEGASPVRHPRREPRV